MLEDVITMARYAVDCRDMPSEKACSLRMSADSREELLEAAAQHAVLLHEHTDTPQLRRQLEQGIMQVAPEPHAA